MLGNIKLVGQLQQAIEDGLQPEAARRTLKIASQAVDAPEWSQNVLERLLFADLSGAMVDQYCLCQGDPARQNIPPPRF